MKKKLEKIKTNIVLSVKYARLQKEVSDTKKKKLELTEKKKLSGADEKQIEKYGQLIESANNAIKDIEQNNSRAAHSLDVNNEIQEQLSVLSKHKDFELIKYSIAVEIVIDDCFEYTENTNSIFIENISKALFNDKYALTKIEENYMTIASRIRGENFKALLKSAVKLISKLPIGNLAESFLSSNKAQLSVKAADFTIKKGFPFLKQKMQAKKVISLALNDFTNKLIISAMGILYANEHFKSETEYHKYFKQELKEINLERSLIAKNLFEEQYEIEENRLRLVLLHNFDDYIIEQMKKKQVK